jgi:hypothetical protein
MTAAQFIEIERTGLRSSRYSELVGIARAYRYPEGLLEYESLVLEGRKPATGIAGQP